MNGMNVLGHSECRQGRLGRGGEKEECWRNWGKMCAEMGIDGEE